MKRYEYFHVKRGGAVKIRDVWWHARPWSRRARVDIFHPSMYHNYSGPRHIYPRLPDGARVAIGLVLAYGFIWAVLL